MVSRKLMGIWAGLDFLLLAAGVISIALSIVWRAPNILLNMVISNIDLTAGMVLGIALIVTFFVSIGGIVQRNHITLGLVVLNYALIIDSLILGVIGSGVWFFTLQLRANLQPVWAQSPPNVRLALQDQFQCCGYFLGNDTAEIGGYCQSLEFISGLNESVPENFCVTPITDFANMTLNNIFTTVYGFMAIILCLLLATLCVIKKRQEDERFKKIDAKRGGRGFV
jgi:hypothetical protein